MGTSGGWAGGMSAEQQMQQMGMDVATIQAVLTARTVRIGVVQILLQLGQQDRTVTWSSPMPSAVYSTDVGNDPLIGKGTAAVLAPLSAASAVVRCNITSLVGLLDKFTVVAWC